MSFDMQTKSVDVSNNQALLCLQEWSRYVSETGDGQLTCSSNGEQFTIKVTNRNRETLEATLSDIKIRHTYAHFHEICAFGVPEISKHFGAIISGKSADNNTREITLRLYHDCEDGETWSKSFSFYDQIIPPAENAAIKAPKNDDENSALPVCAISHVPMNDPVTGPDGRNYERAVIIKWLHEHGTSPFTGLPMQVDQLITNYDLRGDK